MSIWSEIHRDNIEYFAGRIRSYPCGWVFEPSRALIRRTIETGNKWFVLANPDAPEGEKALRTKQDVDGKTCTITKQRTVWCPSGELQQGKYPHMRNKDGKREWWEVPASVCRKCPHHIKARKGYRYPCCGLRSHENPRKAAALDFLESFQEGRRVRANIMARQLHFGMGCTRANWPDCRLKEQG